MIRRALFFIGIFAAGCERESEPAAAAKSFFDHLVEKRLDVAFRETAFFFQNQQSSRDFMTSAHEMGLDGCEVLKLEPPMINGKSAKQLVEVRSRYGPQIPLVATLTRDQGAWRVFSVKSPVNIENGISENRFTHIGKGNHLTSVHDNPLPDERAAQVLAKETMLRFHDAIQQKSFEDFYDGVARAWQRQLTLGMLTRTFEGFIQQRTNLIAIKDLEAVLIEPPRIDSDGLLTITGSYMAQPHRIDFDLKYYYELPSWRAFGVAVRLIK